MSAQTEQGKDRTGFGPWWVAAAVVVLLVVAGLVWVVVKGGAPPAPQTATPTAPRPTTSTAPSPAASTSSPAASTAAGWPDTGCNGTPGSAAAPQVAMRDVTWSPFLAVALPTSPTLGPKRIAAPLRKCFQHSPSGALIAAVNILYAAGADPGSYRKVLTAQMTPGRGRGKMLASFDGNGGDPGNLAAFRLDGCTPSVCNVELVVFGRGVYATQTIPMVWTKGDWYVNGARPIADAGLVQSIPPGFAAWGPTS